MKSRKKQRKLRITEADFMLANRRAARLEEITGAGRTSLLFLLARRIIWSAEIRQETLHPGVKSQRIRFCFYADFSCSAA